MHFLNRERYRGIWEGMPFVAKLGWDAQKSYV